MYSNVVASISVGCLQVTLLFTFKVISGWGILGIFIIHGKFGYYSLVILFLLCGEVLIRSALWSSGMIPSFLTEKYDLHEPLGSTLPPGPDMNEGNYNPPMQ